MATHTAHKDSKTYRTGREQQRRDTAREADHAQRSLDRLIAQSRASKPFEPNPRGL